MPDYFCYEVIESIKEQTGIECNYRVARSMIHPDYANRFIREHIIEVDDESA